MEYPYPIPPPLAIPIVLLSVILICLGVQVQKLYGKYLRAESFRKALVYQKKYLLALLTGFQDSEKETLDILASMGAHPTPESLTQGKAVIGPKNRFRSAARVVVAITR